MLTVYDHLEAAAIVRQLEKEKAALQYQRERQERRILLDEHAEYLRTLTAIDALLYQFEMQDDDEDLALCLIRKMRAVMPPSIVATRKENTE